MVLLYSKTVYNLFIILRKGVFSVEQQSLSMQSSGSKQKDALYKRMVLPNIKRYQSTGITVLPVSALQKFCDKAGYSDDDVVFFTLTLPTGDDGEHKFFLGPDSTPDATVVAMSIYYYDEDTDEEEELVPNETLTKSVYQRFYDGNVAFTGALKIDQRGLLWADGAIATNIFVDFMIALPPGGKGYEFETEDKSVRVRVWFDGESFYSERMNVFNSMKEPC
jgi:hypothetical protein